MVAFWRGAPRPGECKPPPLSLEERLPTRWSAIAFRFKALCFQLQRSIRELGRGPRRHGRDEGLAEAPVRAARMTDLWHESAAPKERKLMLGKVQNLRLAARTLDGIVVPAGAVFSFWKQVGRATRSRGFAVGRELREGCLIPTIGGGLCQLSGALYVAALEAGLEIVERHAHSNPGVSTSARVGRDATVFWNYVDLRLRTPFAWRLEVRLTRDHLAVQIRSEVRPSAKTDTGEMSPSQDARTSMPLPNSCATCGLDDCFRHQEEFTSEEGAAWLVDECWPEYAADLKEQPESLSLLCRPLDGARFRKATYGWDGAKFQSVRNATWLTLRRGWAVRKLRQQGAARQQALLRWDERLARFYETKLRAEHCRLVVAQSLLPFLWRNGVLGGRTFDVLMQRMPMKELQAALDSAAEQHPESQTCADFRAPAWLVAAETEALAAARRWITPHCAMARLAGDRARLVSWQQPRCPRDGGALHGRRIVFPASTLCRKGAYEVRTAARQLGLEVVCLGGILEGADFWAGVKLVEPQRDWLEGARCVVLPAYVEHRPRRLLEALAAGVPVIASSACGLAASALLHEVAAGDVAGLVAAIELVLQERDARRDSTQAVTSRVAIPATVAGPVGPS